MEGLDVVCPYCRKSYHATTDAYDPDKSPRGHMVRLKDPWRKWGWFSFGDGGNGLPPKIAERKTTYASDMCCPGCCAPLAPNGRLTVREPKSKEIEETRNEKIIRLRSEGLSYTKIEEQVDLSHETIRKIVLKAENTANA